MLVFAEEPEQNVLSFDLRSAELAGLISREENHASRFLGVPFEHPYPPGVSSYGIPKTRHNRILITFTR